MRTPPPPLARPPTPPAAEPDLASLAIPEEALDRSVSPCKDFHQHACGGWFAKHPIGADDVAWSPGGSLGDENLALLRDVLERPAANTPSANAARVAGDFYAACMDEASVERASRPALDRELQPIASVTDRPSLSKAIGALHARGFSPFFEPSAWRDVRDAGKTRLDLAPATLVMGGRDDYLATGTRADELRAAYETYVTRAFTLSGLDARRAAGAARDVLAVETELARAFDDAAARRDVVSRNRPTAVTALGPALDWNAWLTALGAPHVVDVNVPEPRVLAAIARIVTQPGGIARAKRYLEWSVISASVDLLPSAYAQARLSFRRVQSGVTALPPRWKQCVRLTTERLPIAVDRAFGGRAVGANGKADVTGMLAALKLVMKDRLSSHAWLDGPTRSAALAKLAKLEDHVGYPDADALGGDVTVRRDALAESAWEASALLFRRELSKLGGWRDPSEWNVRAPSVNATFDPTKNVITVTAGIMRPPFYGAGAPPATYYGALGVLLGHEITHAFDDQGRRFDDRGEARDWWTERAAAALVERTSCLERQFHGVAVGKEGRVDGKLTLGENIADLAGVTLSLRALEETTRARPAAERKAVTRRFFYAFAQAWCANVRPEILDLMVRGDNHAPPALRVNGTLSNTPAFAATFGCAAGDPMVRADRCEVW